MSIVKARKQKNVYYFSWITRDAEVELRFKYFGNGNVIPVTGLNPYKKAGPQRFIHCFHITSRLWDEIRQQCIAKWG